MSFLKQLAACAGAWQGTNRLHDPETGQAEDSPSTLNVTPMLEGRFVRLEYTWRYRGKPQAGALLVGHEKDAGVVTAYWVDSWHNGDRAMVCRGAGSEGEAATVAGSFPAPPGPDWGWDIVLTPRPGEALEMVMHVITPEGEAGPAVEARYTPAG